MTENKWRHALLGLFFMPLFVCGADKPNATAQEIGPKYIFLFIGDGMGLPQVSALGVYNGTRIKNFEGTLKVPTPNNPPEMIFPDFMSFPVVGLVKTEDASKFITDSASAATAIASGKKTLDGSIGIDSFGKKIPSIADLLKEQKKYKIGVITTVSLNHATPAAFCSHVTSRKDLYGIAKQLSTSNVDYFGGGGIRYDKDRDGKSESATKLAENTGYRIFTADQALSASKNKPEKAIVINPVLDKWLSIPFAIDRNEQDLGLPDHVQKGIDFLQNDTGFFMMVEGGKIDWAAHANDAATVIKETMDFGKAVDIAVKFYKQHPDDTLIIVTADHETGGMTIGHGETQYDTYFKLLDSQKISYLSFSEEYIEKYRENKTPFEVAMRDVRTLFGLLMPKDEGAKDKIRLTEYEEGLLRSAYRQSMSEYKDRIKDSEYQAVYFVSQDEPFSLMLTRILNKKSGIGWTTTAHTALPVPVYALGRGQSHFSGVIDNIEIFNALKNMSGIK